MHPVRIRGVHVTAGFYSGGVGVSSMRCYASVVHVPMSRWKLNYKLVMRCLGGHLIEPMSSNNMQICIVYRLNMHNPSASSSG